MLGIFIPLAPTTMSWSKYDVEFQMTLYFSRGRKGTVEILLHESLCCFAFHWKPSETYFFHERDCVRIVC